MWLPTMWLTPSAIVLKPPWNWSASMIDVDVAGLVRVGHAAHLGEDAAQVSADAFDGVVDEGLLAGQSLHVGVEVALTEGLEYGHRLLLHGDVAADHLVDALGHDLEAALKLRRR